MNIMRQGASVAVEHLSKAYGPVVAVDDVSIDIAEGEFMALLGASGSGKTTILTSIAGFEKPSKGEILLDGHPITDQPPHRRGIGMVFQRYALFPHLNVAENIVYPLRRRGMNRSEIESALVSALGMVSLQGLGYRFPSQLSGGQQQRVALARALVFRPPLLLMDEPLSALDRKLRRQMQVEIKLLHRALGTTIVFVTHDQEEALSMADRIAILDRGKLQQVGTPTELYERPATAFVADFIGETNFLPVKLLERKDNSSTVQISCSGTILEVPTTNLRTNDSSGLLGVRPEHVRLVNKRKGIPATVVETTYAGSSLSVFLEVNGHRMIARVLPSGGSDLWIPGQEVGLIPQTETCRIYHFDENVHREHSITRKSNLRRSIDVESEVSPAPSRHVKLQSELTTHQSAEDAMFLSGRASTP